MTMTGMELVKKAIKNGWVVDRIAGSHYIMVKAGRTVSIPVHAGKSVPVGLLNRLLKDLGLK